MTSVAENNKRIAKNTLLLYFRMMITMGVSLFTVRIVLKTLGVVDYGIINVVGGIVVMFSFLSNTMASASQRFFAFELGRRNFVKLKETFSMTVTIYGILSLLIFILAETVGLWFLNHKLVIPPDRMVAANWVYQFSILSFIVTIMAVPFYASIIAHENIKVFAYISIIEVVMKLGIVYLLLLFAMDKLILYSGLLLVTVIVIRCIYTVICKRKYAECTYVYFWDKDLFKVLLGFSGWSLFGSLAWVFNNQGLNILLNLFFGPVINTARGIAYQINNAMSNFVSNFIVATKPQITKYYSLGKMSEMVDLVTRSSKFSYLLFFLLSLPILLETKFLLTVWLKEIPEYVVSFTRLVIIMSLVESLSSSLVAAAQSTGKIRNYQIVVGGLLLLNLPLSYIFLANDFSPEIVFYIAIANSTICLFIRLLFLRKMIGLSFKFYCRKVLISVFYVSVISYSIPVFLLYSLDEGWLRFSLIVVLGVLWSLFIIYWIGLVKGERQYVNNLVRTKVLKKLS